MTTSGTKWVYSFGAGAAEGRAGLRDLLGGKGAGLAEMSNLGLPVPPGFTITTEICTQFYANGKTYPADLKGQVGGALAARGFKAPDLLGGIPVQSLNGAVQHQVTAQPESFSDVFEVTVDFGLLGVEVAPVRVRCE